MKSEDVAELIANITYKPGDPHDYVALFNWSTRTIQVSFLRPDAFTGEVSRGYGGSARIESGWTSGDIMRTVFGLFKALEEHECREGFRVYGVQVFSPHIEGDALLEAGRHIQGHPEIESPNA